MAQQLCPIVVGRDPEVQAIRRAIGQVVTGDGQCVLLVGEPGIGKSRLAREAAGWAAEQGLPAVTGRAVPASGSAAYRPITEALLELLRSRKLPEDAALLPWLPLLQPLLPALVTSSPATKEVSASLRGEAVLQLLSRAAPSGLVAVLEDLHWADPDTVSLVEYICDHLAGSRLLLVLTLRDSQASAALEVAGRLRGHPRIAFLRLDRLDEQDLLRMIRACCPDAAAEVVTRVQEGSEGLPLLVEDLLASPGLPADFAATVKERLAALPAGHGDVIEAAAVLGRHFDWELLTAMTGRDQAGVADALASGIQALLLSSDGSTLRFRHALTRDAVLGTLLPPRQRQLAAAGLAALTSAFPVLDSDQHDLAIDLALRAGERARAGGLLAQSGRQSLAWAALATAADTLRRAADLLIGRTEQTEVELDLIEALAMAGRVEEAAAAGGRLVARLGSEPATAAERSEAHLRLAHAAVAASRWRMARHHLEQARKLTRRETAPGVTARMAVLEADLSMAADDYDAARGLAEGVLGQEGISPVVRCHAFEIVGRSLRSVDLAEARAAFENALITAEGTDLPLWRLRALHELGTVDLFDHAGVERLIQARQASEQMGAMSTAAILDLQLAAAFTCRWDLDSCDSHAYSAIGIAEHLGLQQVRAKALGMLTGSASMRADLEATERQSALTLEAGPEDRTLEGFCWGMRGLSVLLAGERDAAIEPYSRGMAILGRLPHAEPAAIRALWPLVLAAAGDRRAPQAVEEARRLGVAASHLNRAMIGYAEAVLAGRRGDKRSAQELVAVADRGWTNCEAWADLARVLAAPAALDGGWADATTWLTSASMGFSERGLPAMREQCRQLQAEASLNPWTSLGVTDREADVLRLVANGRANKEIAAELRLSPRTVEKHVESLLRKSGSRSRTELVARLAAGTASARAPGSPTTT